MNIDDELNSFHELTHDDQSFRETVFKYFIHWKWFVFSILFFVLLGYTYIKFATPLYKIETYLLIKDNKGGSGGQNNLLKDLDLFNSDKIIDNEIEILKSKALIENVIKTLKLQTSYYNAYKITKKELYESVPFEATLLKTSSVAIYETLFSVKLISKNEAEVNGKKVMLNTPIQIGEGLIQINLKSGINNIPKNLYFVKFNDVENLIQLYNDNIKVYATSKQSTVLGITLEDAIPQRGIDFLNALIHEYNRAAIEDKNIVAAQTLSFIDNRLATVGAELAISEKNVERYKESKAITNIGAQSQQLLQGVSENDIQLSKVDIQISVIEELKKYLSRNNNQSSNFPSMFGVDDPALLSLVQQLGEAQQKKLVLLQTVTEANPVVSALSDQIVELKKAIISSVANYMISLVTTRKKLESKNARFYKIIKQVPVNEQGLIDVVRQQRLQDTLYTFLLRKREETTMNLASGVADSRIVDKPRCSKYPIKPIKKVIFIVFVLLGIIIPVLVIYFKELLNFKIVKRFDIEKMTKTPIIADVSHFDGVESLIVIDKPRSRIAEQIRILRTNLRFVLTGEDSKTILFTSSLSGEGKSFISLNLGASLAMSDKKVVILEFDLRKPQLLSCLNISAQNGLSNYLIGDISYKDIIVAIPSQKNYYVIPSGPIPHNPAELIANGRLKQLFEALKSQFDYIIIDAPPVGLVTDAQILGTFADLTLYITRYNFTPKNLIKSIDNLYTNKKFNNMNIVFNSVDVKGVYGYGGYDEYYEK